MILNNYSIINSICGHTHSGITNPLWIKSPHTMQGMFSRQNECYNEVKEIIKRDSLPSATQPPYSIVLGPKGSLLSSTTKAKGLSSVSGSVSMGINIAGQSDGSGDASAMLSLIVQFAGTVLGYGDMSANLSGSIQLAGTMVGQGNATGALSILAGLAGQALGQGSMTGTFTGYLSLEGVVTPFTTLSPENLANAVFNRLVEGGFSFEDCIKILTAVAAGKTQIVDLGGGTAEVVFRDINDTEDRVTANMTNSERSSVNFNL